MVTANDANGSTTQTSLSARSGVANTVPSLTTPAVLTLSDTAGADSFNNQTGKLDGDGYRYRWPDFRHHRRHRRRSFTASGVTYDVSRTGTYGTLHVNSATGAYVFVPNSGAINATSAAAAESFTVTVSDGSVTSSTTLSVAVAGTLDAPIAADDTGSALEAGGISNGTAGSNATGNVLTNDTDADTGLTRTVTAVRLGATEGGGTAGSVGTALAGSYGTLTLKADGTYTYVVNNRQCHGRCPERRRQPVGKLQLHRLQRNADRYRLVDRHNQGRRGYRSRRPHDDDQSTPTTTDVVDHADNAIHHSRDRADHLCRSSSPSSSFVFVFVESSSSSIHLRSSSSRSILFLVLFVQFVFIFDRQLDKHTVAHHDEAHGIDNRLIRQHAVKRHLVAQFDQHTGKSVVLISVADRPSGQ